MKKKPKKLNELSKEELKKTIINLDMQLTNAIKMVASLRFVLKYELRTPQGYWEHYTDVVVEEDFEEEQVPPDFKTPMKSKKKKLEGYQ